MESAGALKRRCEQTIKVDVREQFRKMSAARIARIRKVPKGPDRKGYCQHAVWIAVANSGRLFAPLSA